MSRITIKSAADYLRSEIGNNSLSITTKLDIHLCVPQHWSYRITEFACCEGIHMSSICMKICANVLCQSKEKYVVYITMKNTFSTEMLSQEILNLGIRTEAIQQRVIVYDVCNFVELISVVYALQNQHIDKIGVTMVIIDGICIQPYSKEINSNYLKIPYLTKLFHLLKKCAVESRFIVVVTNDIRNFKRKQKSSPYHDERHYNYVDLRTCVQHLEDGTFLVKMIS